MGENIDGNHRLTAVVSTGLTFDFAVETGLHPDVFTILDSGKIRSYGDVFEMAGIKNAHQAAAIVNFLENKKIPYIITQTVPTEFQIENYTDKCIPITFDDFNEKAGRKRAKGNHWLSDSHEAWAIELHNVIETHYGN